jgi:reductive dehalogenase
VGICRLPSYAVYSHDSNENPVELNHKNAILIVVDQGYETFDASNGSDWISSSQAFRSYTTTAFITTMMADYIRKLGFPARAHFNGNYQVVVPPLLLLSGIGEMSRMGNSVINPFLGPRFKAAVVTTDLPLEPDGPVDFGLQAFCQTCMKCAEACPARAIPTGDKVMYNGYECWKLDVERCAKFRVTNPNGSGCGTCIKVCPWNKPTGTLHDTVRWMALHTPWLDRFLVRMDTLMGYGKRHREKQWWFDLEEVDGVMQVPKGK